MARLRVMDFKKNSAQKAALQKYEEFMSYARRTSPNSYDAVKYMPNTDWKKLIGMDKLFGRSALEGIEKVSEFVENRELEILTHTNIFKDDVIEQIFLPYLNVNNGIAFRESTQEIVRRNK